jgi:hypothetical protein
MREFLFQYFKPHTIGCEVGVWQGEFSQKLLTNVHPSKLYLVDPWIVRPDYEKRWYSADSVDQNTLDRMHNHVVGLFKPHSEVVLIRDLFESAASLIPDNELDWIYIDGDHSEDEVYKDLCYAYKKVKPLGYIVGDDFSWVDPSTQKQSVRAAVERFLQKYTGRIKTLNIHNGQFVLKKE